MERGVVLVGVGVDVGAEPLRVEVDALAVARARALERHVLDDVAQAVLARALVVAAGADEDADGQAVAGCDWRSTTTRTPLTKARDDGVRIVRVGAEGRHAEIQ